MDKAYWKHLECLATRRNLKPNPKIEKWEKRRGPKNSFILGPELIISKMIGLRLFIFWDNATKKCGNDYDKTILIKPEDLDWVAEK